VQLLQTELTVVKNKVQQLETRDKRRNIIVHGIAEINKETWKQLDDCIKILGEKLGIEIDYDQAYRLGKPGTGKERPIFIRLLRTRDKLFIFSLRKKLKGTKIFINEDLDPEAREINSLLTRKWTELLKVNRNVKSYIRNSKLFVEDGTRRSVYSVLNGQLLEETGKDMGLQALSQ